MYIFSAIFLFLSMDDTIVMATTQFKVLFNGEKVSLVKKDEKKTKPTQSLFSKDINKLKIILFGEKFFLD